MVREDDAMPETILLLHDSAWKAAIVQQLLAQSSEGPFVVEWLRSCAAGFERLNDPMMLNGFRKRVVIVKRAPTKLLEMGN